VEERDGFARTYGVELLCVERPKIWKPRLLASLRQRCPGVASLDGKDNSEILSFIHTDHPVQLADGQIPAQTFIAQTDKKPTAGQYKSALEQSWNFPEARDIVERCTAAVLVTDLMSSALPYKERLDLFQRALLAVLEVVPCEAIHWQPTQQMVSPAAYRDASQLSGSALFFAGAVNVRLFNITGSDNEIVMDTLGLGALGLPDLQCHFRNLEPSDVARVLYNAAWYVFEAGDVIEDGHTLQGTTPSSKWRCQHEDALVAPARVVVDMNPGPEHTAGCR
jgi:hypothetical protein